MSSLLVLVNFSTTLSSQEVAYPNTHSHNDYLQNRPLNDALQHGFISVEADILLREGILYVGHDRADLVNKPLIDLTASYIDPLFERYKAMNEKIYPGYDDLFYLWIDIKYAGEEVFTRLKKIIRPYRSMLFSKKRNKKGKVMIIVSGARPMQLLLRDVGGYLHIDGRPSDLDKNIDSDRMPFISQHIQQVCRLNSSGYLDDDNFNKLNPHYALAKLMHNLTIGNQ